MWHGEAADYQHSLCRSAFVQPGIRMVMVRPSSSAWRWRAARGR
jgi:hypothetical protein